jgi:hypothetical protein
MRTAFAAVIALNAWILHADDFKLSYLGAEAISLHTNLTYEGKGEKLEATAKNESGKAIQHARICILPATAQKGCLFELWNTVPWKPGAELNWSVTAAKKIPSLSHIASITLVDFETTPDTSASLPVVPSAAEPPRSTPIPQGVTLCLQPMSGGFDAFLIGEMQKQKVPVTIISTVPNADDHSKPEACDPTKSSYTMSGTVVQEGKSFSARSVFGLRLHLRDEIQAAVKLVRNSDNAVVWAGDADRGEVKTVAEHIVNQMLKQRPIWVLSPITR